MKMLLSTWILLSAATYAYGQPSDTSRPEFTMHIEPGKPLLIQYNHGGCFISHSQQILVEDASPDSLFVTLKRLLPVAYRLYRYNKAKKIHEAQDSVQIKNPYNFTFPGLGEKDYARTKEEYLPEKSFRIYRPKLTNYITEFISSAEKGQLPASNTAIEGTYCNIQFIHNNLNRQYSFRGWYAIDIKIQLLQ